jgi:hypothetical protein
VVRDADCPCSCSCSRPGECPRLCALVPTVATMLMMSRLLMHLGPLCGSRWLRLADVGAAGDAFASHCSCCARCDECQRLCSLILPWLDAFRVHCSCRGCPCGGSLMMMLSCLVMQPAPTVPAPATAPAPAAALTAVSARVRGRVVWGWCVRALGVGSSRAVLGAFVAAMSS